MERVEMMAQIKQQDGRFYINEKGNELAELVYEEEGSLLKITHTHVIPPEQGEGLATELVDHAVQYARNNNMTIDPVCSFAEKVLNGDSKYEDVLNK
ncbi:N-acetyltransferase [Halobacillus sp. A1]|uniref:GNAT family N-acetyltransferase n=1 Tax=Halobacillus sp. A1 TaxID=2880262 RepID=UPI0020A6D482|nr:GNAT family N-acetyltransferase [Halobacillus sp. A1]MCP3029787.1 N-acetyltransferase [Halobacillus sp. A1]